MPLLALALMLFGVLVWGGFNTTMEVTNRLEFCISCHEMAEYIYPEYQQSSHYLNGAGVQAVCADCHVPRSWGAMVWRKLTATDELWHKFVGTIDTPERFEARRLELARKVWSEMKANDSRECRNCHDYATMAPEGQGPAAQRQHLRAMEVGNTCIDCHKGIAHRPVHSRLSSEEFNRLATPDPSLIRPLPPKWKALQGNLVYAAHHPSNLMPETPPVDDPVAIPPPRAGSGPIDWPAVAPFSATLFYPGQASLEWSLRGRDHEGARAVKAGDRCFDCHDQKAAELGARIVVGSPLEPRPIPGKRGSIPVELRATHDERFLYLRLSWPDVPPATAAVRMDQNNRVKVAMMLSDNQPPFAEEAGCWATCHDSARGMAAAGEIPRGKHLSPGSEGYLDLLRYRIDEQVVEDGHVAEQRVMSGGQGAEFAARLESGFWVVDIKRQLISSQPGDISLQRDRLYTIGFAIHDDYSNGRHHHVSVGYRLGFDNIYADINLLPLP